MLKNINKFMINTAVMSTILVGCAKHTPEVATAAKNGISITNIQAATAATVLARTMLIHIHLLSSLCLS